MPIQITCDCGKQLQVGEEFANQQGKCPVCGRLIDIPSPAFSEAVPKDKPKLRERISAAPIDISSRTARLPSETYERSPPETRQNDWLFDEAAATREQAPPYKLYSPIGIGLAAFLGGPLGGALVMAINNQRLGKRAAFWITLAVGLVSAFVLLAIAVALLDEVPSFLPGVCACIVAFLIGIWLQGARTMHTLPRKGERRPFGEPPAWAC